MKKLIVNADDFGSHELVNFAVNDAFNNGICKSASIMAGGNAFDDAVKIALLNKNLGVGIHFTLVKGTPVLPPSKIKSLVDSSGNFCEDFSVFVRRYLTGRINFDEVKAELSAQAYKIQNSGIKISHVDSHQHLHVLPKIFEIVSDLAIKLNVKAMRIPHANPFAINGPLPRRTGTHCLSACGEGNRFNGGGVISKIALNFLSSRARHKAKKLNFAVPDKFFGIVAGGSINEKWLCSVIDDIENTAEIMTHVGSDNKILQASLNWDHDFEAELNALKSDEVKDKIKINNVEIINFKEI